MLRRLVLAAVFLLSIAGSASAEVRTETFRTPAVSVGGYEVKQSVLVDVPKPQVDGAITNMSVDVVDKEGKPVPISRLMLHHIVFMNTGRALGEKKDATCDQFKMWDNKTNLPAVGERFYAAGEERATMDLPAPYGYTSRAGDKWQVLYMFMNHKPNTESAYIQYTVTYDTDLASRSPVKPYWLDVSNCRADPIYNVPGGKPAGASDIRDFDFEMPEPGRIVGGGGHVHGGGRKLELSRPDCSPDPIVSSRPTWGTKAHPFYNVRPRLHEPGPINMSAFQSRQGIPVAAGEKLRLRSIYDAERPHMRVMGIMIVYVAPDASVPAKCQPLPTDLTSQGTDQPGRRGPIPYRIPLNGLNAKGRAVEIDRPPGPTRRFPRGATVRVGDNFFSRRNISIRRGSSVRYVFDSISLHNVTLANGPRAIGTPNATGGGVVEQRFSRPGVYNLVCSLHPVVMQERVIVR